MSEVAEFTEVKNEIFSFVQQEAIISTQGVDEFAVNHKLKQLENNHEEINVRAVLSNLVDKGYIELNYPDNSYVGYYK